MSLFDKHEDLAKSKLKPLLDIFLDPYEYSIGRVKEKHSEDLVDFEVRTFCDLVHDLTIPRAKTLSNGVVGFSFIKKNYFKLIYEDDDVKFDIRYNKANKKLITGKTLTFSAKDYDNHKAGDTLGFKDKLYLPLYCAFTGQPPLYKAISYYFICPSSPYSNNWAWYLNDDYAQLKNGNIGTPIIPITPITIITPDQKSEEKEK